MNDERFDRLLKAALSWRAEEAISHQPPRRLAMRRLALRLSRSAADTPPPVNLAAGLALPRGRSMPRLASNIAGVAAVLVVAVLVAGYLFLPSSQPGASGPLYVSERHGYSLRLPDDSWKVTEWPGEWALGSFLGAEGAGSDYFQRTPPSGPPQRLVFAWLGSQPIPADMTFDDWIRLQDEVTASAASCFELQDDYEYGRVAGEAARLGVYYCPNFNQSDAGWATVQVLLAHAGRGYAMYFWPEQEPDMAPLAEVKLDVLRWLSHFEFTESGTSR